MAVAHSADLKEELLNVSDIYSFVIHEYKLLTVASGQEEQFFFPRHGKSPLWRLLN